MFDISNRLNYHIHRSKEIHRFRLKKKNPDSEFGLLDRRKERAEPWFVRFRVRRNNLFYYFLFYFIFIILFLLFFLFFFFFLFFLCFVFFFFYSFFSIFFIPYFYFKAFLRTPNLPNQASAQSSLRTPNLQESGVRRKGPVFLQTRNQGGAQWLSRTFM